MADHIEFPAVKLADKATKEGRFFGIEAKPTDDPKVQAAIREFADMPLGEPVHVMIFRDDGNGNPVT